MLICTAVWEQVLLVKVKAKKVIWVSQLFHIVQHWFVSSERPACTFATSVPVGFLVSLRSLTQISSRALTFLILYVRTQTMVSYNSFAACASISTCYAPFLCCSSSRNSCCVHQQTQYNSPLHHAGLLLQHPVFLHSMMVCSWALSIFSLKISLLPILDTFHGILLSKFLTELKCTLLSSSPNSTTHIAKSPLDPELNPSVVTAAETAAPFDPNSSLPVNNTSRELRPDGQFHNLHYKVSPAV